MPQRIKNTTTNTKLLQTHVPNFRGQKNKLVEFQHFLLNHLSPLANTVTQENKLHFFQSLLGDESIENWQSIQITPATTLKDVSDMFRKEFAKEDLKEAAFYKWDQARYNPTSETPQKPQEDRQASLSNRCRQSKQEQVLVRQFTSRDSARTHHD